MRQVLKHHVDYAFLPLRSLLLACRIEVENILEPNDVLVVKLFEDQYFSQRSYGKTVHLGIQLE